MTGNSDQFAFITWQRDTGVDDEYRYRGGDEKYWNTLYTRINVCNMVIALIDEQPEKTPDDTAAKERIKGEAYFLRGLYYFMLTNLYCEPYNPATADATRGMPLKFTEYVEDIEFNRATLASTYQHILDDLNAAERCLEGKTRKSIYRANQLTVRLLLSRVYLYMQDWEKAAKYAKLVIDNQPELLDFRSIPEGANCLSASSPETIFSMGGYSIAVAFADDRYDIPGWLISDDMLNLYSDNDLRANTYIGESQYRKTPGVLKKINGQREALGSIYEVGSEFLFRTPEAYLILAEASAYNNDESTAKSTLEKYLAYRMTGPISVTQSGNDLIDFIRDERAREFLIEGHRWFDLRRYTVCKPYPWSKVIEHQFAYYEDRDFSHFDLFRLEQNDPAYTLPIPRSVYNFQISLGANTRPERKPFATKSDSYGSEEDDDNWW